MAKQSVSQLKQWFETADQPTQEQFWDAIDSFFHKDGMIPMESITNLTNVLNTLAPLSAVQYAIPSNETNASTTYSKVFTADTIIDLLFLKSATAATVTLKFNGVDYTTIELEAGKGQPVSLLYACDVNTTLSITDLPINSTIKIYKR